MSETPDWPALVAAHKDRIEIQQHRINHWLRHHTEYQVIIHLNTIYGCIGVQITKNNEHVKGYIGTSLAKRLDQVVKYLQIDEWEGPKKWWKNFVKPETEDQSQPTN